MVEDLVVCVKTFELEFLDLAFTDFDYDLTLFLGEFAVATLKTKRELISLSLSQIVQHFLEDHCSDRQLRHLLVLLNLVRLLISILSYPVFLVDH